MNKKSDAAIAPTIGGAALGAAGGGALGWFHDKWSKKKSTKGKKLFWAIIGSLLGSYSGAGLSLLAQGALENAKNKGHLSFDDLGSFGIKPETTLNLKPETLL